MSAINQAITPHQPVPHTNQQTIKPIIVPKPKTIAKPAKDNQIIEFSNSEKKTHKTKNFVVLYNGFPLQNKTFNLKIQNESHNTKAITLPVFKTDTDGILSVLVNPVFNQHEQFEPNLSEYRPLKFSERLGFVIKDTDNIEKKNIFYRKKYIGKYIDLGISIAFLRTMIKKTQSGTHTLDASDNQAMQNWVNAFYNSDDIAKNFKQFNTHTERTAKALKYTDYGCNALLATGVTGLVVGSVAGTMGIVPFVVAGIGGGIMAAGSSGGIVSKYMEKELPDISRLRDTEDSAESSLKR